MKKRLFILTLCSFIFINVSAQTEKGRFALSGKTDLSLMFGKTSLVKDSSAGIEEKSLAFNANIGFAYFVVKNLALSVSGSFRYNGVKEENYSGYIHNFTAGVIPGVTYFIPVKGNLKPTISAGAGYVWYFTPDKDAEGLSLNVAPGLSYFVNKNISLDLGVQYSYNDLTNKNWGENFKYKQQAVGFLFGLSFYF